MIFTKKFAVLLFSLAVFPVFAQLAMVLTPNQMAYMQYEPIYMHLRIRNDSGRPIVFGLNRQLQATLYFEITDLNGKVLNNPEAKPIVMSRGKVINPGQIGDIVLKFSHYFQLTQKGYYRIHAYISHPMFKEKFKSNDVRIEIASGVVVWKRTLGIPDGQISSSGKVLSTDSTRTFYIRKMIDGSRQFYYCTLEDQEKIYQVFRMGPAVGIDRPVCLVDMSGALHIMTNIAPKIYKYYKIDITGEMLEDGKYYKTTKTRPELIRNNEGKIYVSGGAPAVANVDYLVRDKSFKDFAE